MVWRRCTGDARSNDRKQRVIGAGSVVVKDIPSDSVAVGNPCKVIRPITEEDKKKCWDRT